MSGSFLSGLMHGDPIEYVDRAIQTYDDLATEILFSSNEPEESDLAIVFGEPDRRILDACARRAIELYRDSFAQQLMFTGSRRVPDGNRVTGSSEAVYMQKLAVSAGIPRTAILRSNRGEGAWSAMSWALTFLREKEIHDRISSILLVGCPWQMKSIYLMVHNGFGKPVKLLCCPHKEFGTAEKWREQSYMRWNVAYELQALYRLERSGVLPSNWRDAPPITVPPPPTCQHGPTMGYSEAIEAVKSGKRVVRLGWRTTEPHIFQSRSPHLRGDKLILCEGKYGMGGKTLEFQPHEEDIAASDWVLAEPAEGCRWCIKGI